MTAYERCLSLIAHWLRGAPGVTRTRDTRFRNRNLERPPSGPEKQTGCEQELGECIYFGNGPDRALLGHTLHPKAERAVPFLRHRA